MVKPDLKGKIRPKERPKYHKAIVRDLLNSENRKKTITHWAQRLGKKMKTRPEIQAFTGRSRKVTEKDAIKIADLILKGESVKKIVLINHPDFVKQMPGMEHAPGTWKKKIKELKAIIKQCKKEQGTHVVVSWWKYRGRPKELTDIFHRMDNTRLHQPKFGAAHGMNNYVNEDLRVVKALDSLDYAPEVELHGYGEMEALCLPENLQGLADIVSRKAKIKRIVVMGGTSHAGVIERAKYHDIDKSTYERFTTALDTYFNHMRHFISGKWQERIVKKEVDMKKEDVDTFVVAWPREYKLKEEK